MLHLHHLCTTLVLQVVQMALRPRRDEPMTQKTIPESVMNLLSQRWPADDARGPHRYLYRPDDTPTRVCGGLKHSQVRALVNDRVLTNDWRGLGDAIALTADEHQALSDFLTEVYAAWGKCQNRLELARGTVELGCVG